MKINLISPRIAIQKGDFLGSGVPYWPIELVTFATYLKNSGYDIHVYDLFSEGYNNLSEDGDRYWQGKDFSDYDPSAFEKSINVVFAISFMSLKDIKYISEILRDVDEAEVIVMENSQAVTAFDVSVHMEELFDSGVGHILLGEPYFNSEEVFNKIGNHTEYREESCPNLISSSDVTHF